MNQPEDPSFLIRLHYFANSSWPCYTGGWSGLAANSPAGIQVPYLHRLLFEAAGWYVFNRILLTDQKCRV
jgi:hypothetical protein